MGEAKRRASAPPAIVYHHTSQIRTNLIWMSGMIDLEGNSKGAQHPLFGEIMTDVRARRACKDFRPLAWFSASTRIPRCLLNADIFGYSKLDGSQIDMAHQAGMDREKAANFLALKRFALGFPNDPLIFMPWSKHYGYDTAEGRDLNETAREAGDDPDMWYVAETPVDVMRCTEIWASRNIMTPRLEPFPAYLPEVHKMVSLCRKLPSVVIPPSWTGDPVAEQMIRSRA